MKVLFLARLSYPHVGGVEKHIKEISSRLTLKGFRIQVVDEAEIRYPHLKFFGLLAIWFWLFKNRKIIEKSDIVYCHDVFIWYLPFRFLYPQKPVYTTFHGWEGIWPIPRKNIFLKRLAARLSWGNICVGQYIEKYYGIKSNFVVYGATMVRRADRSKGKNRIVFVGRLEKDTGLLKFLRWLRRNKQFKVDFCGAGRLSRECKKYGRVHGFTNPLPFWRRAEWCVPGGYLSALEAMAARCKIKVFWENPLKKDYWTMTPFYKYIKAEDRDGAFKWVSKQSWENVAQKYIELWRTR